MHSLGRAILLISFLAAVGLSCSDSKNTDLATQLGIGDPVITEIDPPSGAPPIGATAGTSVTIKGRLFTPDVNLTKVTFNGVAATVLTATSTEITTTVPAGASTGTLFVSKGGVVYCDPDNGSAASNCYGRKFYIDCYKSFNNQYGDEFGVSYPNSKTFQITGQTGTKALRIDLNPDGPTNVKIACDTLLIYTLFSKTCSQTNVGTFTDTSTWVYQPTLSFPSYYTVQMFVTAGQGNCEISFP
ncbi:DNA-binding protein [Leptospira wolffii]|uniref:LIC10067 family putative lipoprotein n=1 Tax=Leptospira wolffii TaxID=409998 RepID=UPI001082D475|nr:IPT/TIG domain-containing protein [Leptospira wolffii]TGK61924.1 DNA-binding protein [Leptospira wolffii]TGK68525.1 DNA-binding protein [Leptospira wolffii]TGK74692.1 DNA-binding protein [Leptospira wolffii]TGL31732.1 DNA-binding protein [Leptospira wolffii]